MGQGEPSLPSLSRLVGRMRLKTHVTSEIQGKSQLEMKLEPGYGARDVDSVLPDGGNCVITNIFPDVGYWNVTLCISFGKLTFPRHSRQVLPSLFKDSLLFFNWQRVPFHFA